MATTNTITLNQMKIIFNSFADRHLQINSFYYGDIDKIGDNQSFKYPMLAVIPADVNMNKGQNSYAELIYNYNILICDILQDGDVNIDDVRSDTIQILQDLVIEFNQNSFYRDNMIQIINNIVFTPFVDRFEDLVTGHSFTANIQVAYRGSYCDAPINPIEDFENITSICDE